MAPAAGTAYVKRDTMLIVAFVALIVGFLGGVVFGIFKTTPDAPGGPPAAAAPPQTSELRDRIAAFEKAVEVNPEDGEAWTALGNLYFDTNQFKQAIAAYRKSIELRPGDPNTWTDLGVMYRRDGQPQEALAAFEKAVQIDPLHEPSRFNMGVVRMHDLDDREGALQAWQDLVKVNPSAAAPNGQLVKDLIEMIRQRG